MKVSPGWTLATRLLYARFGKPFSVARTAGALDERWEMAYRQGVADTIAALYETLDELTNEIPSGRKCANAAETKPSSASTRRAE